MLNDTSIRDWLAVTLTVGVLAIVIIGQFKAGVIVPDRLWDIYFTVIGFFFATSPGKNGNGIKPESPIQTPPAEVTKNVG